VGSYADQLTALETEQQELADRRLALIEKAIASADPADAVAGQKRFADIEQRQPSRQKTYLIDPDEASQGSGYRDQRMTVTYDTLRRMARTPVLKPIIETRIDQIASFATPPATKYARGFVIEKERPWGTDKPPALTREDHRIIEKMSMFVLNCGRQSDQFHGDDFELYLRKSSRDSLILDKDSTEIIQSLRGLPCEVLAVDGATIFYADNTDDLDPRNLLDYPRDPRTHTGWSNRAPLRLSASDRRQRGYLPHTVQIYQNQIVSDFYPWELALGIRNASTDVQQLGYGISELEDLISTVTAMLNAQQYNANFFKIGSAPKGFLRVKGSLQPGTLQHFRAEWRAMMAGVQNAHRTPVFDQETDWVDLEKNNRDMEYSHFQEYLIKLACAAYKIDPSEIGFPMQGASDAKPMFEGNNSARLAHSRDKGLVPLLRFKERIVNRFLVRRLAPGFRFRFVGIDTLDEQAELDQDIKRLGGYMTLNEIRQARGLKPLPYGDMPMNPTYIQAMGVQQATEQAEADAKEGKDPDDEADDDDDDPFSKALADSLHSISNP
jgi:Phage portal protein